MASIEITDDGVTIKGRAGVTRAMLRPPSVEGPAGWLFHDDDTIAAALSFSEDNDRLVVTLFRPDGSPGVALYIGDDGRAYVLRCDGDGEPARVQLALDPPSGIDVFKISEN